MPQFDVSTLTDLTDRPVSSGVISSADHEAWRNDIEARITALNNAAKAIAANQSGSAEPTVKHQGEIFFDTDNNYWYANPAGGGYSDNVLTRLTAFNFNLATGGTATHKLMGAINVNTTANARTTTGDFTAYTLPGGSLGADGQLIRATFWGTRSGVAGTFSLQPIFGTTNIGTAFASTIDSLTDWMCNCSLSVRVRQLRIVSSTLW